MRDYPLTEEEYADLAAASQPVRYLVAGGRVPTAPEEVVNQVWRRVAARHGVRWDTITPSPRGDRFFQAEPR